MGSVHSDADEGVMGASIKPCGRQACYPGVVMFAMVSCSIREAGRLARVGHTTVSMACDALGVAPPKNKRAPKRINKAAIKKAWMTERKSVHVLAADLGMDSGTLRRHAKSMGLPDRPLGQFSKSPAWPSDFNAMWVSGVLSREIAAACSGKIPREETVSREASRRGLPKRIGGNLKRVGITAVEYFLRKDAERVKAATKALWEGREAA